MQNDSQTATAVQYSTTPPLVPGLDSDLQALLELRQQFAMLPGHGDDILEPHSSQAGIIKAWLDCQDHAHLEAARTLEAGFLMNLQPQPVAGPVE